MASMSASGPAGAWEIASARIQPFIFEPNKHRSSGGSRRWFAAFMRITTEWLAGYAQKVLTCWWQPVFLFYTCIVGVNPQPWMFIGIITDKRLFCFHQTRMSCTNITKYTVWVLDRHPSEKYSELIHSLCSTSMISYQSQWDSACLATDGTWQWGCCM